MTREDLGSGGRGDGQVRSGGGLPTGAEGRREHGLPAGAAGRSESRLPGGAGDRSDGKGGSELRGEAGVRGALAELLEASRRAAAEYRRAEDLAGDHRVRAVLGLLRQDHERHSAELSEVLAGAGEPSPDPAARPAPVRLSGVEPDQPGEGEPAGVTGPALPADSGPAAFDGAAASGGGLLDSAARVEAWLEGAYRRSAEGPVTEGVRVVLRRHARVLGAHLAWLREGRFRTALLGVGGARDAANGSPAGIARGTAEASREAETAGEEAAGSAGPFGERHQAKKADRRAIA